MIKFAIVGSGSKGNATLVYNEDTIFQIDMGVPLYRLRNTLKDINKTKTDVEAIFVTHDHSDHVSNITRIPKGVDIYASPGNLKNKKGLVINEMDVGTTVQIGSFKITSFPTSHDSINPVGYLIESGDESLAYITDTGMITKSNVELLKDKTYYIIEANHDLRMLSNSKRPTSLKKRIHCYKGHLSNQECADYMVDMLGPNTKGIYLAHLSAECNKEERVRQTFTETFDEVGISLDNVVIETAMQFKTLFGGGL